MRRLLVDPSVATFLDAVSSWSRVRTDVRGTLLVGSQARNDTPADDLSDVDLVLFVDDPERYLRKAAWLRSFGEPLLTFAEPTAVGGFEERRVLFDDGLEVDFSILPVTAVDALPPEALAVLARGFSVIHDELGLAALEPAERPSAAEPTQAGFDQFSNDFWYHLMWAAKKLQRGEVLLAKQACDCYLTAKLVELVRWQAQEQDTWHGLRFFERWAEDELLDALPPTFARYDAEDVGRALRAKGELFGELERGVAERFTLVEPVDRDELLRRLDSLLGR